METKTYIYIGIAIGSIAGGAIGAAIDNGNVFGLWSILFSTIGGIVGIWAGYKLGNG
mgnify:CR=1 FL=1|jgi:uncharacterized membrane protein